MQYPGDASFPTAADWAQSAADDAKKHATTTEAQLQRLVALLVEKGTIGALESVWVAVGGPRNG